MFLYEEMCNSIQVSSHEMCNSIPVAHALQWILKGVSWLAHYLDDYITVGPPGSTVCAENMTMILSTCEELGISIAFKKSEGPASLLTFRGIELDMVALELRVPAEQLRNTKQLISAWSQRKSCSRRELESLVGHLNHACRVARPG